MGIDPGRKIIVNIKQFSVLTFCLLPAVFLDNALTDGPPQVRALENQAFAIGEKLCYILRYGPIGAGRGIMEVKDIRPIDQHPCYHVVSITRSNDFFSLFFRVKDQIESFIDTQGIFSRGFRKKIHEGSFKTIYTVFYDHEKHLAISKNDTTVIPPLVQDPLSSFYFLRTCELTPGKSVFVNYHSNNEVYRLEVQVLSRQRIKVKAGRFNCLVVRPLMETPGVFFKPRGKLTIWLTDDQRKMPVLMKLKLRVGSLTAELTRYWPKEP